MEFSTLFCEISLYQDRRFLHKVQSSCDKPVLVEPVPWLTIAILLEILSSFSAVSQLFFNLKKIADEMKHFYVFFHRLQYSTGNISTVPYVFCDDFWKRTYLLFLLTFEESSITNVDKVTLRTVLIIISIISIEDFIFE